MSELTQADTTAARNWFEQAERDGLIRRGNRKDFPLVQAFAAHRIATESPHLAQIAKLTEALEAFVAVADARDRDATDNGFKVSHAAVNVPYAAFEAARILTKDTSDVG